MFAGAAREAVFSNAEVIKRVNADFVPVALKAALVNRPPDDEEGLLYREIERSKPAPQGICVVNSAGKVLTWTMMFDDDKSLLAFFDHIKERYAKFPDAKKPVAAEVYVKFPSQKRKDVEDSGKVLPVIDRHPEGKYCPAEPPLREGTVAVRLFGRALDKDGKPVADTVRQENYIEDRFNIDVPTQEKLAKALSDAGKSPVKLPIELTRQWVKQTYMGVLDVQPLDNPGGGKGELKKCDFGATKVETGKRPTLWRVDGESEVFIDEKMANGSPGDMHEVKLTWHGFIEMDGNRMTRLMLSASGAEKLKFGSARGKGDNEVASLPGGRRINMVCGVRYGVIGEPVAADKASKEGPAQEIPDEARQHVLHTLGGPFFVCRDKVQDELKLSDDQKQKLRETMTSYVQETMRVEEGLKELKAEEREKETKSHRQKSGEKLEAFLKETLKADQLKRFQQLKLQYDTPAIMLQPEIVNELKITDEQRKQFMDAIQDMQKEIEPLIKKARSGGNPEEIRPKVIKLRQDCQGKIEALLSNVQKKQWQEMTGKPFIIW